MASLNKLAIRGIRSFDDKQVSVIEFFSPVTVIVGHNGSGKTTIIECLKYATTGDQPPNTRGGAFVHDPKMANEKEVKAQVKLRFHAANGTRMIAVRNLSVTVKKTGLTMKTLESILAVSDPADKDGKRGVISTKCAEMDAEIPQLLGVSKAVLENVIFCHQEDSYWPLAEPSALKKKFDDIFEATRYTKALTSITALRKERVSELKAEKERLVGLSREKSHADKLKARISDLTTTIASKEIEYEERKKEHDVLAEANRRFYENSTKFRETYVKVESLEDRKKALQTDLDEVKLNIQELPGTDEELVRRLQNHDNDIVAHQQKRRTEEMKKQDLEDDQSTLRDLHTELVQQHGALVSEAEMQEQRIAEREALIHEISSKHSIKGFNHTPLEGSKIIEFLSKLRDYQRKQGSEFEQLQTELRSKSEEHRTKTRQLDTELETYKLQKKTLRDQISSHQNQINEGTRKLASQEVLPTELRSLQDEIAERKVRIDKIKADIAAAGYDTRLSEKAEKAKSFEERRDGLNTELRSLSLQADTRARLDLKRGEVRTKSNEMQTTLENANAKFSQLAGKRLDVDTINDLAERLSMVKEKEATELESEATTVNNRLQKAESTLSSLKSQVKAKRDDMKALEKRLGNNLDLETLDAAIKEADLEVDHRKALAGNMLGGSAVYESLLRVGRAKQKCGACNRHLDDQELVVFEKYVKDLMKKASPESIKHTKEEMKEWETELNRLQSLRPIQVTWSQIKERDLPALEKQIREEEALIADITSQVERALERLNAAKSVAKDIIILKQFAANVLKLQKEVERANNDIASLEADLATTGSTKTADDVQAELNSISAEMRTNDREKQTLLAERDRQNNMTRTLETSLHSMELQERDLTNALREKTALEERVETMTKEIAGFTAKSRELDAKIVEAQAPIDALEEDFRNVQTSLSARIQQAQTFVQELNMSNDKLNQMNKAIERYAKTRGKSQLEECRAKVEETDAKIREVGLALEAARESIAAIDKEISSSGNFVANLRENIRLRKLIRDIADTQSEIDKYDMEEVAKAKRNFEQQYGASKTKQEDLQAAYNHIQGEISSHKSQLKSLESDLKEFKNVNKQYTDQLIKVKMSDMANDDLEKYAKALDHAIMKYHGLKMEEVNDTMKHLWNKTYQGTDIDGIKIRSDVEGGASKRSYNYRVVMTKDQVEMDMRGRCSAGQKMLASIIIRLALSDSFGQNCGILALDEPTNALDTENIDALAESLVDIINERKNHSNFQLVIITHDENFLRKLGQSDVMEYYWRVSRDSRQKSMIERQRFR